jgi:hypothetical protein
MIEPSLSMLLPLAPAALLLLGALLLAASSLTSATPFVSWVSRGLAVVLILSQIAVLLAAPAAGEVSPTNLVPWLDQPGLGLRLVPWDPAAWSLLAAAVAALLVVSPLSRRARKGTAALLAAAAVGWLVVLSGDTRTLVFALFAFDAAVALLLLVLDQKELALARLLLGAAVSTIFAGAALALPTGGEGTAFQDMFVLLLWVRLGLYPLVEGGKVESGELMPLTVGWHAVQIVVGLYLVHVDFAAWLLWPAIVTALLHAALAWLGKNRERAVVHLGYALISVVLVGLALGLPTSPPLAAALLLPAGLMAAALTPTRGGGIRVPQTREDWLRLWGYVPLLLVTLSLVGAPFTLGASAWGAVFGRVWEKQLYGVFLLLVFAQGAGLSVLYRYWRPIWQQSGGGPLTIDRAAAASLVAIPFLLPILGYSLWLAAAGAALSIGVGGWIGLGAAFLWALFLGYSQPLVLRRLPLERGELFRWLRLEPVTALGVSGVSLAAKVLLRLRVIFEGEHYLAWAVLWAIFGILLVLVYSTSILP